VPILQAVNVQVSITGQHCLADVAVGVCVAEGGRPPVRDPADLRATACPVVLLKVSHAAIVSLHETFTDLNPAYK
jgi:hypothetical protein